MSDLLKKNWMNESLSAGSSMGQTSYDNEGLNNQTPLISGDVATDPIVSNVSGGNSIGTFLKNTGKGNNYMQMATGALAVGSGVLNYGKGQQGYQDTIDSMNKAIGGLDDAKRDIQGALYTNTKTLKENLSESSQDNALAVLEKNKTQLMALEEKNTDFQSGQATEMKNKSLASINKVLGSTFKNQQMKMNTMIDQSVDRAKASNEKITAKMDTIRTELDKVKEAKDNQGLNLVKDFVAYSSLYLDPTGISKDIIQSTKHKNEYT